MARTTCGRAVRVALGALIALSVLTHGAWASEQVRVSVTVPPRGTGPLPTTGFDLVTPALAAAAAVIVGIALHRAAGRSEGGFPR